MFAKLGLVNDDETRAQSKTKRYYYVERTDSDITGSLIFPDPDRNSILSNMASNFGRPNEVVSPVVESLQRLNEC